MIYPTLIINDNKNYDTINFIDTEFEDNPFIFIDFPKEDSFEIFLAFCIGFLNTYHQGWDNGFDIGWKDCADFYEIDEDEDEELEDYGDINLK